jgi:hypothetical protein
MHIGRKLLASKINRWGSVKEMTFATPESPASTTEAIARIVARFADWSVTEAIEDSLFKMSEMEFNESLPMMTMRLSQKVRPGERALLSIFGAASGCATVVDLLWNQHFILGREHNITACYKNWAASHNLRAFMHWKAMAKSDESKLDWFESEMERAARGALFSESHVNVLKTDEQQDVQVYRKQIARRISKDRLRHFVAEKFPTARTRGGLNDTSEEVVLVGRTTSPNRGLVIGGAVWDREHFASGKHVVDARQAPSPRHRWRPSGADDGGGRWWSPE